MRLFKLALIVFAIGTLCGCRSREAPEPGLATPTVTLHHDRVPLGSPVDITYTFVVAPDARPFDEAYRVFVGFVDTDERLMWSDDHYPSIPTTEWKPNQTITYTRTIFVPIYPYVGDAAMHMGLYSMRTQKRLPLNGEHVGQHAYRVARLQLQPQTENVFTRFKEGWHPAEVAEHNALVEWQWTKKSATLAFRNPKRDAMFYLDLDNPSGVFNEPQLVKVSVGETLIEEFPLPPKQQLLKKIPLTAAQLGPKDMVELRIDVDKTFVPALAQASTSKDPRELGVRVFHVFVQPGS